MKASVAILLALVFALPAGLSAGLHAAPDSSPCESALDGWQIIPDTSAAIPNFVFDSRLDIKSVIVCDDGVYFFFATREWGRYVDFCLVYPEPTQEQFAKYVGTDEPDIQKRTQMILAATARSKLQYDSFRGKTEEVLGSRYAEGKMISFKNSRRHAELKMKMGEPLRFSYGKRSVDFSPFFDVWFKPSRNVPGWVVFLLLYPR